MLKAKRLSVITWDDEDVIEEGGREVRVIPLWK